MTALRARPLPSDPQVGPAGRRARARLLRLLPVAVGLAVVVALLVRFATAGSNSEQAAAGRPDTAAAAPALVAVGAAAAVVKAQAALRQHPGDPTSTVDLGVAYLARARETADASYYTLADRALTAAAAVAPDDLRVLVGQGLLALSRHQFTAALGLGDRATRAYPDSAEALGVVVDAQVELGRYPDAVASAQAMLDRRPDITALSRISYLRELHGDPAGAITALTQARTAGSGAPSDVAYVLLLLGDLLRGQGRLDEADRAYRTALAGVPGYVPATVGLARLDVARGDLPGARTRLASAVTALPLPETVAFYGDVLAALGEPAQAAQQYTLVRSIEALQRANGVVVDLESARFEADHARDPGADPQTALALARQALADRPTIYGHDALGWALRQAGHPALALPEADLSLALHTRDAMLYYHRAAIEADLGRRSAAIADLTTAFAISPQIMSASSLSSMHDLTEATALASRLGIPVPAAR